MAVIIRHAHLPDNKFVWLSSAGPCTRPGSKHPTLLPLSQIVLPSVDPSRKRHAQIVALCSTPFSALTSSQLRRGLRTSIPRGSSLYSQRRFFTARGVSAFVAITHISTAPITCPIAGVFQFTLPPRPCHLAGLARLPFSRRPELPRLNRSAKMESFGREDAGQVTRLLGCMISMPAFQIPATWLQGLYSVSHCHSTLLCGIPRLSLLRFKPQAQRSGPCGDQLLPTLPASDSVCRYAMLRRKSHRCSCGPLEAGARASQISVLLRAVTEFLRRVEHQLNDTINISWPCDTQSRGLSRDPGKSATMLATDHT